MAECSGKLQNGSGEGIFPQIWSHEDVTFPQKHDSFTPALSRFSSSGLAVCICTGTAAWSNLVRLFRCFLQKYRSECSIKTNNQFNVPSLYTNLQVPNTFLPRKRVTPNIPNMKTVADLIKTLWLKITTLSLVILRSVLRLLHTFQ